MLAVALTVLILSGYAASLWWFLRRESTAVFLVLTALCGLSLSLRLVYTTQFPPGMNEDETRLLYCSSELLKGGNLFAEGCTGLPVLLNALFQAQLLPILGPTRWAVRSYSLIMSVLATLAAFAAARSLRLRAGPSLAVAAFVTTLPWSLLYGRMSIGGELVFHQLLLLAALARLITSDGGWPEVGIGSFGLSLLLYDYFAGRAMLGMPLIAAVLARGKRRLLSLAVLALALIGWAPYLRGWPANAFGGLMASYDTGLMSQPVATLTANALKILQTFVHPVAMDGFLTIASGALHPLVILVLAALGAVTTGRRSLFLLAGFAGGLLPAIASGQASTHRMLMAFPFIALAAGCILDRLPWRPVRLTAAAAAALVVGVQSVMLFFSPHFWTWGSHVSFAEDNTALVEAIPFPRSAHLILAPQIGYAWSPHGLIDHDCEVLTVDNWLPPNNRAQIYAFASALAPLRPLYDALFGPGRVKVFGDAFLVTVDAADWSWLRRHGWQYELDCGPVVHRARVPTLFDPHLRFRNLPRCPEPVRHVWRGRWDGPREQVRLRFSGAATVDGPAGRLVDRQGYEQAADFTVEPGTPLTVQVLTPDSFVWAALFEITPAGERLPAWESVSPLD